MKVFKFTFFLIVLVGVHYTVAQTTSPDSLSLKNTIRISPGSAETPVDALGNFAVIAKDSLAFRANAGQSVINTLRGHIPNLSIGASPYNFSNGLRSSGSLLVIDGLPYGNSINSYYNLNSYEYKNLYAISGGSANMYGGSASNGAILLESKTGENFYKPTFEIASSPTFTWADGSAERIDQWLLTNAISYQQDFGKIDTRLSYNFTHVPDDNVGAETKANDHYLKLNTGFDITPRFNIRLIIDENHATSKADSYFSIINGPAMKYQIRNESNLFQGNVHMRYRVLDWLTLSSQTLLSKIEDDYESSVAEIPTGSAHYKRAYTNVFASLARPIIGQLSFNAFAGMQYESQAIDRISRSMFSTASSSLSYITKTSSLGAGLQLSDYLFFNYNYRLDNFSMLPTSDESKSTFSLTSSFVFSNALGWNNNWFSLGKIRGSYGDSFYIDGHTYPQTYSIQQGSYTYSDLPMLKSNTEVGLDLGFLDNRIVLQSTYFKDLNERNYGIVTIPWGPNGRRDQLFNLGAVETEGWEFVLATTPIKANNVIMNTKFIYGTFDTKIKSLNRGTSGGGSLIIPYDPNPDWRGSILNQLIWKKIFFTFLIDVRKGGDIMTSAFGPDFDIQIEDGSFTRLRDVSLGINLTPDKLIRQVNLSVSGRNLWMIYSKSGEDIEGSSLRQKGIGLNAVFTF